jgi:hypothetical protein
MASSAINITRFVIIGVVLAFSLGVLAVGAHILAVVNVVADPITLDFVNLAIAISALTVVTMVPMLIISILRKGAFVNYVAVEFTWLSILWILWLASAGLSTNDVTYSPSCNFVFVVRTGTIACQEPLILQGFAWVNWIILFGYTILLLVLAIIQQVRGNSVWIKSINEVDLFAPRRLTPEQIAAEQKYGPAHPFQLRPVEQLNPALYVVAPRQYTPQEVAALVNAPLPQQPSPGTIYPPQQPSPGTNYTTPPPQQPSPVPAGSTYPQL